MLAAADADGVVVHIRSLTKVTAPSMRIAALTARGPAFDRLRNVQVIDSFFVPRTMTVSEVSIAIYDDTTHALELLQLNAFDDALAIPPGTIVEHYAVLAT